MQSWVIFKDASCTCNVRNFRNIIEEISVKFDNVIAYEKSKADNPLDKFTRFEEINQPVYLVADVTLKKVSDIFEDNGPVYRSEKACSLEHVAGFGAAELV